MNFFYYILYSYIAYFIKYNYILFKKKSYFHFIFYILVSLIFIYPYGNKIFTILFVITKALGNNKALGNKKNLKKQGKWKWRRHHMFFVCHKETTHVLFCLNKEKCFPWDKRRKTLSYHKALLFSLIEIQFPSLTLLVFTKHEKVRKIVFKKINSWKQTSLSVL